jgi:hypothetical protein
MEFEFKNDFGGEKTWKLTVTPTPTEDDCDDLYDIIRDELLEEHNSTKNLEVNGTAYELKAVFGGFIDGNSEDNWYEALGV